MFSQYKLGCLPAKHDNRTLRLAKYLVPGTVPQAPAQVDWQSKVASWPMMGNDQYGDCVVEGSLVSASDVKRGYRAFYDGPIVRLRTASGKVLAVTPNHAVLTPAGFRAARFIKEGDDLIGTRGAQVLPRTPSMGAQLDFNDSPTPIEQIVESLRVRTGAGREIVPRSVYFHGDGKFVNRNIQVVGSDSPLGSELNPALGQPYGEDQVRSAGKLKGLFHRNRPALHSRLRRLSASLRNVSLSNERLPLAFAHSGVAKSDGLPQGSEFMSGGNDGFFEAPAIDSKFDRERFHSFTGDVSPNRFAEVASAPAHRNGGRLGAGAQLQASLSQPSMDGVPTDSELSANLFRCYPGLIESDRVISVERDTFAGHVYDLSTGPRWYITNGIITHNCTIAAAGHLQQLWSTVNGTPVVPSDQAVVAQYMALTGGQDSGLPLLDVMNAWRQNGLCGNKIGAYAAVTLSDHAEVAAAIWLFGGIQIGVQLPLAWQGTANWQAPARHFVFNWTPWARQWGKGSWGGHSIPVIGYDATALYGVSWGQVVTISWAAWDTYFVEAYAALDALWVTGDKAAPSGFDIAALNADLQAIGAN